MAETQNKKDFLGELRLGRQLTAPSQVTAGGVVLIAGLLLLQADQALELTGGRAVLAALAAFIVIGLTLLNALELLGGSGERGGSYMMVHEELRGWVSYLVGWGILAGFLALAAAAARLTAQLLLRWLPDSLTVAPVAVGIVLLVIVIQLLQFLPGRFPFQAAVLLVVGLLIVLLISLTPGVDWRVFIERGRFSLASFNRAVAWLAALYAGFEAVLLARRRVEAVKAQTLRTLGRLFLAGGFLTLLTLFLLAGVRVQPGDSQGRTLFELLISGFLPTAVVVAILAVTLLAAAGTSLMSAARQAITLSQEGAFPLILQGVWGSASLPLVLLGALALGVAPAAFFLPVDWLVYMASFWFLAAMTILDFVAIHSRRTEEERRRILVLPFSPLIPALAIVANLVLMAAIPWRYSAGAAGWLAIGLATYFLYARAHQLEADEGEMIFGTSRREKPRKKAYRILVPIGQQGERHFVLRLANALARQLDGEVVPLQVVIVQDPLAIEEGQRLARERNTLFRWSVRTGDDLGVPTYPVTRLAHSVPEGIIETAFEEDCDLVLLTWAIHPEEPEPHISSVLSRVSRAVTCDVAVAAYHPEHEFGSAPDSKEGGQSNGGEPEAETGKKPPVEDGNHNFEPRRILVPTAGGPHAPLAIRLAVLLANEYKATVQATYVGSPDASPEQIQQGEQRIDETIAALREQVEDLSGQGMLINGIDIHGEVAHAESVVEGIVAAGSGFDLILMGASEESLIDQFLFGNLPEQTARQSETPVVIVKRYRGLPRQWLRRAWDTAYESLPTLNQEDQGDVYRKVYRDARPDVDFFVMMGLSTLISVTGLVQGSVAVIIGAMLVAPLFSPLLGISLSLAVGSVRLLRIGTEAMLKGVALSLGAAALVAWILPLGELNSEVMSRTQPNLLDLMVALSAGAAGAYAIARKDVAAALPGVAIAAALVPPLAVVGIGMAMGDLQVVGGSGLLLITNLVSIILAGLITFLLLGFRPGSKIGSESPLRRGLLTTIALVVMVTVPLAVFFYQSVTLASRDQNIERQVSEALADYDGVVLVDPQEVRIRSEEGILTVTVPIYIDGPPPVGLTDDLQKRLSEAIDVPVGVRVVTYLTLDALPPEGLRP